MIIKQRGPSKYNGYGDDISSAPISGPPPPGYTGEPSGIPPPQTGAIPPGEGMNPNMPNIFSTFQTANHQLPGTVAIPGTMVAAGAAPKAPASGLAAAGAAAVAGFFVAGPVGALVGAAAGYFLGKPKAAPAASGTLVSMHPVPQTPGDIAVQANANNPDTGIDPSLAQGYNNQANSAYIPDGSGTEGSITPTDPGATNLLPIADPTQPSTNPVVATLPRGVMHMRPPAPLPFLPPDSINYGPSRGTFNKRTF